MIGGSGAERLANAIAATTERINDAGVPWCPPELDGSLRKMFLFRSQRLGSTIGLVVRFVRALSLVSNGDPMRALYVDIPSLRPHLFKQLFKKNAGRMAGRAIIDDLNGGFVRLLDDEMRLSGRNCELNFSNMPVLGAVFDILYMVIGVPFVELIDDVIKPRSTTDADLISNAIRRQLDARLNSIVSSNSNRIKESEKIRSVLLEIAEEKTFLERGLPQIDDGVIVEIWRRISIIGGSEAEGFKKFKTAARKAIRFQRVSDELAYLNQVDRRNEDPERDSVETLAGGEAAHLVSDDRNPFIDLVSPRFETITWVKEVDLKSIPSLFGTLKALQAIHLASSNDNKVADAANGKKIAGEEEVVETEAKVEEEEAEEEDEAKALCGSDPFSPTFALTLFRDTVFTKVQTIVGNRRKEMRGATLDDFERTCDEANQYVDIRRRLESLRSKFRITLTTALRAVGDDDVRAVILAHFIQALTRDEEFKARSEILAKIGAIYVDAKRHDEEEDDDGSNVTDLFDHIPQYNSHTLSSVQGALKPYLEQWKENNVRGLKKSDYLGNEEAIKRIEDGVPFLIRALEIVERTLSATNWASDGERYAKDVDVFLGHIRKLYLGPRDKNDTTDAVECKGEE